MQRERRDTEILGLLEEAQSQLMHGHITDGARLLGEAITELDRHVQEWRVIERAMRIGLNAPSVMRGIREYQAEFAEETA